MMICGEDTELEVALGWLPKTTAGAQSAMIRMEKSGEIPTTLSWRGLTLTSRRRIIRDSSPSVIKGPQIPYVRRNADAEGAVD
jgi:hypothetical protein